MDNRRKTIVINKKFQYQYALFIVALTVLLVNVFLILRMLFPGDQPLALSSSMVMGLALVELLLVVSIWYGSLKASHRIAGPVHVFTREIARLGEGDLNAKIVLRDKDMFQAQADLMNESFTALRTRIAAAQTLAGQLQQTHSSGGDVGPLLDQLASTLGEISTGKEQ